MIPPCRIRIWPFGRWVLGQTDDDIRARIVHGRYPHVPHRCIRANATMWHMGERLPIVPATRGRRKNSAGPSPRMPCSRHSPGTGASDEDVARLTSLEVRRLDRRAESTTAPVSVQSQTLGAELRVKVMVAGSSTQRLWVASVPLLRASTRAPSGRASSSGETLPVEGLPGDP